MLSFFLDLIFFLLRLFVILDTVYMLKFWNILSSIFHLKPLFDEFFQLKILRNNSDADKKDKFHFFQIKDKAIPELNVVLREEGKSRGELRSDRFRGNF